MIAHRGASAYLPEHTLEAYAMAHAQGADYIEPDLVMTKDKRFICLHDIHLELTTNVEQVFADRAREDGRWYAIDFTLEEIKQLRVEERLENRFPKGHSRFEIPTFEEMIELIQGLHTSTGREAGIYPELKAPGWHHGEGCDMEEDFMAIMLRYGYTGKGAKVFVQCFEPESLRRMRSEFGSELRQIQLMEGGTRSAEMLTPQGLDGIAKYADGIGPAKQSIERNPDIVDLAHARGLLVHPYTFRRDQTPKRYESYEEELDTFYRTYDVDGVFTDFSDATKRFLEK